MFIQLGLDRFRHSQILRLSLCHLHEGFFQHDLQGLSVNGDFLSNADTDTPVVALDPPIVVMDLQAPFVEEIYSLHTVICHEI